MSLNVLDDRNIKSTFFKQLDISERGTWALELAMKEPSDRETESYKNLGSVGQMREWVGARHSHSVRVESYTILNRPYENTLDISDDDVRRDKTGQIIRRTQELAIAAGTHPESLLSALLIANGLCYDGQNFFDADHSSGDSGTHINELAAAQVAALNVTTVADPTPAEMAKLVLGMIAYMFTFKDDAGEPVNQNARSFTLMVPILYMGPALQAVSERMLASGSTAITNPLIGTGFNIRVLPNPRLTWTDKVALFRTDGAMKPLIWQEEVPVTFALNDDSFANRRRQYGIYASRGVGYGLWQHAVRGTLS